MYFGDHAVSGGPWGVHLEGQWRRHDAGARWQQLLLRPGVNYQVNENLMLTAGYAFVDTFRYGEFPIAQRFPEHRIFQQAALKHPVGRVGLQHRYRLEQRFLGEVSVDGNVRRVNRWRHENRFRYMVRAVVPLRGPTSAKGGWYLALYDEFFLNFGANVAANIFDQNRAYAAVGYGLRGDTRLEFGYMNQIAQQRNGRIFELNHTLQLAVFSTFPFGSR
jgi:hypothetical protein